MKVHSKLLKLGLDTNPVTVTQLLQRYASQSCLSSLTYARQLFDQIPHSRDAFLWAAMISTYARSNFPDAAIRLLSDLLRLPAPPSPLSFAFASSARAAAAFGDPFLARSLHGQVIRRHILPNIVVATSLIDMYSKCCCLGLARKVFDGMSQRNAFTWNSLIAAYASVGIHTSALQLFYCVKCIEPNIKTDEFAIASGMTACAALCDLRTGMQIHGYSVTSGFLMDPAVANATTKMYFRCREVRSAERVFEGREVSLFSEIIMIKGYIFNEKYAAAVQIIRQSRFVDLFMEDSSISLSVLSISSNLGMLRLGMQVHGIILTLGYYSSLGLMDNEDAILYNSLIDMYSRCSSISKAWLVFLNMNERDASHWNALISGCIYNGLLQEACCLFNEMPFKNVISWTSMISGYVQHGLPQKALDILSRMYNGENKVRGNSYTFATALDACSCIAALDAGMQIHAQVLRTSDRDGHNNVIVETALVDMYSRSGSLANARKTFDNMQNMNVLSWTSMITGYATHGLALEAIKVFENMIRKGFVPNEVTFVSLLNACSRSGLIEQGLHYFNLMKEKYGIDPRGDHSACMVDMLGRAGKLAEAQELLVSMDNLETKLTKKCITSNDNDASIWGALLGECKLYENVEIGSKIAKEMINRKHKASGTFVALSNFFASSEDWDAVYNLRKVWKKQGFIQRPGHSIV